MRNLIIRECAVKACDNVHDGASLFLAICKEALTGEPIDWDEFPGYFRDEQRPVYEAIAPDIIASVGEEPTEGQVADIVGEAICDVLTGLASIPASAERRDEA